MSLDWVFHFPLFRTTTISFTIVAVEPLRIGSQREVGGLTDLPVVRIMKDGERVPFIPGSSLKGVLRTISEGLWSSIMGEYVHAGNDGNPVCPRAEDVIKKFKKGENSLDKAKREIARALCPVCLTFGVPSFMSKVLVGDFFPTSYSIGIITQASIHRKKGTAQSPRQVEYVEPGSNFKGSLKLINAPNWMVSMILASLYLIDKGLVKLGGHKSRGFGAVKIEDLVVESSDLEPLDLYDMELDPKKINDLEYAYNMWNKMAERLKERYGR